MDRLLKEGKLPNVARLLQMGAQAEYCIPADPSVTATGHASIWTGAWPDIHGITGNRAPLLPQSEHTALDNQSGFSSLALLAEPIYMTAAKQGKKVVVLSGTHAYPPEPHVDALKQAGVDPNNTTLLSGFEYTVSPRQVVTERALKPAGDWPDAPPFVGKRLEAEIKAGEATFYLLAFDDPQHPAQGLDSMLIRQGSRSGPANIIRAADAQDNVDHFSGPFKVGKEGRYGFVYFRLFRLSPDGSQMLLYMREANAIQGWGPPGEVEKYVDMVGGFHDLPFNEYERGSFGKTLVDGGDGLAERRLMELIRFDMELLKRGSTYAIEQWRPDLLMSYTPASDSAGHCWMGVLDPDAHDYDPALAAKIWPFYTQVYQLQDEWLGTILDASRRNTVVALVSDHGMEAARKSFSANKALEEAGLLFRDRQGRIDLARTKAMQPPWGGRFVIVNGVERKGGIVPTNERESVLKAVEAALLAVRDSETGLPVVIGVKRPETQVGLGMGGPAGGDLYFETRAGYKAYGNLATGTIETARSKLGCGDHGGNPFRPKLQAIFYLGGTGVAKGTRLPGVRQIDIAPTLCYLMGIRLPAQSQGRAILEAVERRP